MSSQDNTSIDKTDFKAIVGLIALAAFLLYVEIFLAPPAKERRLTHYFGNAAMELPESWQMWSVEATFYLTDENTGPQITFWEVPPAAGGSAFEEFEQFLKDSPTIKKATSLEKAEYWRTDFSEILGRPALIGIREVRPNNFGMTIVNDPPKTSPPGNRLEIHLALPTKQATLYFKYQESIDWPAEKPDMIYVAGKQKALVDWALAFTYHFQWIGDNSPQSGKNLATRFGRIGLGDDPAYQWYNIDAVFTKTPNVNNILSVSLCSLPSWAQKRGTNSHRTSKALEEKRMANSPKSYIMGNKQYSEEKRFTNSRFSHDARLTWHSNDPIDAFSPEAPSFNIYYYKGDTDDSVLAEALATWATVLDTLRILPSGNTKD